LLGIDDLIARAAMTERLHELLAIQQQLDARANKKKHPEGWEPGLTWKKGQGVVVARSNLNEPNWSMILTELGLDPDVYEIASDTVSVRSWDTPTADGLQRAFYFRADVRLKKPGKADVDALIADIRKRKPKDAAKSGGESIMTVVISDTQIGKEGTAATVQRFIRSIDLVAERWGELRKAGRPVGRMLVACLGDLIEQVAGHYPNQAYTAELDHGEQMRVMRRLLIEALVKWSKLPGLDEIIVAAVPGNHGEQRPVLTRETDNDDLLIVEMVAEVLAANPGAFGHIKFVMATSLTQTLQPIKDGPVIGMAHGHQTGSGPTPQARVQKWWSGQALGQTAIGDCDILLTAHYHSFQVATVGKRTWMQSPALDSGSPWFTQRYGIGDSKSGMLTFAIDQDGWSDLQVLDPNP